MSDGVVFFLHSFLSFSLYLLQNGSLSPPPTPLPPTTVTEYSRGYCTCDGTQMESRESLCPFCRSNGQLESGKPSRSQSSNVVLSRHVKKYDPDLEVFVDLKPSHLITARLYYIVSSKRLFFHGAPWCANKKFTVFIRVQFLHVTSLFAQRTRGEKN